MGGGHELWRPTRQERYHSEKANWTGRYRRSYMLPLDNESSLKFPGDSQRLTRITYETAIINAEKI